MKYAVIYDNRRMYDVKAVCVFSNTKEREKGMFTARMKYIKEHKSMNDLEVVLSILIEEVTAKEAHRLIKSGIEVINCKEENSLDHSKPIYCLKSYRSEKLIATSNSLHYIINKIQEFKRPNVWVAVLINKKAYSLLNVEGRLITIHYEGLSKINMDKVDLCKRIIPYCGFTTHTQHKDSIIYKAER